MTDGSAIQPTNRNKIPVPLPQSAVVRNPATLTNNSILKKVPAVWRELAHAHAVEFALLESVGFGMFDGQNRAGREAHDAFGDATEHGVLESGQSTRSHHNEVRFDFLGCQVDCQRGTVG
jgi:hypothetical protein